MDEQTRQWRELAERAEALALKLKMHLEQASDDDTRDTVKDALGSLRSSIDEAFQAAGNAVKDDAVRDDVRAVGQLLTEALDNTFARVGREVRELFGRRS
jgi:DUF1365 family protein